MEVNEKTKIKYIVENEHKEQIEIIFTLEQIEGSTPNFYKQLKNNLEDENCKIIKREIIKEEK